MHHEFGDTPDAAARTIARTNGVFGLRRRVLALQKPCARPTHPTTDGEEHGNVDDCKGQHDSHWIQSVNQVEYRIHERRIGDAGFTERSLQDDVVDQDLGHPRQEKRGKYQSEL